MTREEAQVCFEYHLLVTVDQRIEWAKKPVFFIKEIAESYDSKLKQMQCSAVLENDGRACYHIDILDINYPEKLEDFVQSKVRKKKNEIFRLLLSELVQQHKTKKQSIRLLIKRLTK